MYVQYMSGHGDQKRVIRSPGVGVIKACEPLYSRRWKQRGVLCRVSVIIKSSKQCQKNFMLTNISHSSRWLLHLGVSGGPMTVSFYSLAFHEDP